jgi:tetratricopeptide (TPR) repeat protein
MLLLAGKQEEATTLGQTLFEQGVKFNDPSTLNLVSWLIVDPEMAIASRNLDLAMKSAEKAVELSRGEEGAILDTLARVYYWKGDLAKAIEIQTKAVEKAQGEHDVSLQETLDQYKAEAAGKKNE